jgi:hypothetical protein
MKLYLGNGTGVSLKTCLGHVTFDVLTVVKMKVMIFLDVTPCSSADTNVLP